MLSFRITMRILYLALKRANGTYSKYIVNADACILKVIYNNFSKI